MTYGITCSTPGQRLQPVDRRPYGLGSILHLHVVVRAVPADHHAAGLVDGGLPLVLGRGGREAQQDQVAGVGPAHPGMIDDQVRVREKLVAESAGISHPSGATEVTGCFPATCVKVLTASRSTRRPGPR
jgi:hypothetical protein